LFLTSLTVHIFRVFVDSIDPLSSRSNCGTLKDFTGSSSTVKSLSPFPFIVFEIDLFYSLLLFLIQVIQPIRLSCLRRVFGWSLLEFIGHCLFR
jgi:hypothetical protein